MLNAASVLFPDDANGIAPLSRSTRSGIHNQHRPSAIGCTPRAFLPGCLREDPPPCTRARPISRQGPGEAGGSPALPRAACLTNRRLGEDRDTYLNGVQRRTTALVWRSPPLRDLPLWRLAVPRLVPLDPSRSDWSRPLVQRGPVGLQPPNAPRRVGVDGVCIAACIVHRCSPGRQGQRRRWQWRQRQRGYPPPPAMGRQGLPSALPGRRQSLRL